MHIVSFFINMNNSLILSPNREKISRPALTLALSHQALNTPVAWVHRPFPPHYKNTSLDCWELADEIDPG